MKIRGFGSYAAHPAKAKSGTIPNTADAVSKSVAEGNFEFSSPELTGRALLAFVGQGRNGNLRRFWPNNTSLKGKEMIPKITLLEIACLMSSAVMLVCIIVFSIAVFRKKKASYRVAFVVEAIAALCLGFSYVELDRIHGLLFQRNYSVKTKNDLLALFGEPTRIFSGNFRGEKVDAWVYKIDLIRPRLEFQFEFHKNEYRGAIGHIDPPRD